MQNPHSMQSSSNTRLKACGVNDQHEATHRKTLVILLNVWPNAKENDATTSVGRHCKTKHGALGPQSATQEARYTNIKNKFGS